MKVRRQRNGKDGVFVFLPFYTIPHDKLEAVHVNEDIHRGRAILVNVGWVSIEEYKENKLRNFRLPDSEKFEIVNNEISNLYKIYW